jgi:hypothetical protein
MPKVGDQESSALGSQLLVPKVGDLKRSAFGQGNQGAFCKIIYS